MVKGIFIGITYPFVVLVVIVVIGTNIYAQSDEDRERQQQQQENTSVLNMTDKMKFFCIQVDASGSIDQRKDKEEQQAQCKKFLDSVSIYELEELINKFVQN
jgi:hypothetical protein